MIAHCQFQLYKKKNQKQAKLSKIIKTKFGPFKSFENTFLHEFKCYPENDWELSQNFSFKIPWLEEIIEKDILF